MATPAYKFIDRRGLRYANNQLHEAATQTNQRKQVPFLDYDTQRNVSSIGRRTLLSIGRKLYSDSGAIRGTINEIARTSVGSFIPQFVGADAEWGNLAEKWLRESDKWLDIRGIPAFSFGTLKINTVKAAIRDGELFILLTEKAGIPKVQGIHSHRVASALSADLQTVDYAPAQVLGDGTALDASGNILGNMAWQGKTVCDGVIVDETLETLAYRLNDGINPGNYRDISANDMVQAFIPDYCDQLRGISLLASVAFDCLDFKESRRNELIAQLINSTFAVQIKNETGTIDTPNDVIAGPASDPDSTTGAATTLPTELLPSGQILYFKNGQGGVEEIKSDRPGVNFMNFQAEVMRTAMHGIEWSTDFSIDPTKAGGAQMRIVVEKINARVKEIQDFLVAPIVRRIDGWRIAKAIKMGFLPPNDEWWKWEYQGPAEVTADAKYDSDIDLQENRAAFTPLKRIAARRGEYWEEVQDQCIAEEKRFQERCKAEGVDPNRVRLLTPNGNAAISAPDQSQEPANQKAAQ